MLASLEGTPPPTLETRDGFSVRVLKADSKQGACCPPPGSPCGVPSSDRGGVDSVDCKGGSLGRAGGWAPGGPSHTGVASRPPGEGSGWAQGPQRDTGVSARGRPCSWSWSCRLSTRGKRRRWLAALQMPSSREPRSLVLGPREGPADRMPWAPGHCRGTCDVRQ